MKRPIIGITPKIERYSELDIMFEVQGQNAFYVDSIKKSGGIPLLLPIVSEEEMCHELLSLLDGIVFTGGHDLSPYVYGEDALAKIGEMDPTRDVSDVMMLKMAKKMKLPILGICKGEQLINAVFGGTLYQDISYNKEAFIIHSQKNLPQHPVHFVDLIKETHLSEIYPNVDQISVNSLHHQCVKDLAPEFRASAIAKDGVIEAIEYKGDQFILGVQWHPEMMYDCNEDARKIFDFFVEKVRVRKKE